MDGKQSENIIVYLIFRCEMAFKMRVTHCEAYFNLSPYCCLFSQVQTLWWPVPSTEVNFYPYTFNLASQDVIRFLNLNHNPALEKKFVTKLQGYVSSQRGRDVKEETKSGGVGNE